MEGVPESLYFQYFWVKSLLNSATFIYVSEAS